MKPSNSGHSFNVKTKYIHSVMLLCFLIAKWFCFIFQPTFHLSMLWTCLFKFKQAWSRQIPSLNIIISGFLCDLRKSTLYPYNHTKKITYFLKHLSQKHFKTGAGSFSGNLPDYPGIIISVNSSSFTSVDTPSEQRQYCSKEWIPQQILSIN